MLGAARLRPPAPTPLLPGALYARLDGLPLSRSKRRLARDFSDGVMLAEVVKHVRPQLGDLHTFVPTCSTDRKLSNGACSTGRRRAAGRRAAQTSAALQAPLPALVGAAPRPLTALPPRLVWVGSLSPALPVSGTSSQALSCSGSPGHLSVSLFLTPGISRKRGLPPGPTRLAAEGCTPPTCLLHRKVFHKLRSCVSEADIRKVVGSTPEASEPILCALGEKVVDCNTGPEDPPSTADPGVSRADAAGPWVGLATPPHTGLLSPPPSSTKTLLSQRAPEKTGPCVCRGWDPACGPWEHLEPGVQQRLEEKDRRWPFCRRWSRPPAMWPCHGLAGTAQRSQMVRESGCQMLVRDVVSLKILQMKVERLEHLVRLKDRQIAELTRRRDEPMREAAEEGSERVATPPKSARP
ncbi:uncharacterized protein RBU33_026606 [Hipposideros larvatus]